MQLSLIALFFIYSNIREWLQIVHNLPEVRGWNCNTACCPRVVFSSNVKEYCTTSSWNWRLIIISNNQYEVIQIILPPQILVADSIIKFSQVDMFVILFMVWVITPTIKNCNNRYIKACLKNSFKYLRRDLIFSNPNLSKRKGPNWAFPIPLLFKRSYSIFTNTTSVLLISYLQLIHCWARVNVDIPKFTFQSAFYQ